MSVRIAHLTLQPIENDARVARSRDALVEAGYDCPVIGPGAGFDLPLMTFKRKSELALAYGPSARMGAIAARAAFFSFAHHRQALAALLASRPDAIHAHDWDALVIAERAARLLNVPYAYDAHEFAAEMHAERVLWRLTVSPLIRILERRAIAGATLVFAVSGSIGEHLRDSASPRPAPITLRNMPDVEPATGVLRNAAKDRVLLHYHGILARGRGIEAAIEAIDRLPPVFQLRLTGPWRQPGFQKEITQRLSARTDGRIIVEPPLPHGRLVAHASEADIGLCLLESATVHDRGALPNKIFEYLNAGLALIASGSTEVAKILATHGCGASLARGDASELAALLQSWTPEQVRTMRLASLRAAKELSWKREKLKLVTAWDEVLRHGKRAAPRRN